MSTDTISQTNKRSYANAFANIDTDDDTFASANTDASAINGVDDDNPNLIDNSHSDNTMPLRNIPPLLGDYNTADDAIAEMIASNRINVNFDDRDNDDDEESNRLIHSIVNDASDNFYYTAKPTTIYDDSDSFFDDDFRVRDDFSDRADRIEGLRERTEEYHQHLADYRAFQEEQEERYNLKLCPEFDRLKYQAGRYGCEFVEEYLYCLYFAGFRVD
jgi:hypothetical protein